MDERLNQLLKQEIKRIIESLKVEKAQLENELKKYENKEGSIEKTSLQKDLEKVNWEIEVKTQEFIQIGTAESYKGRLPEQSKLTAEKYQKLLKEKAQYEEELKKTQGHYVTRDGKLVPTKEQEELQREISKIDEFLAKYKSGKEQNKQNLGGLEEKVQKLYEKYKIKEKLSKLPPEKPQLASIVCTVEKGKLKYIITSLEEGNRLKVFEASEIIPSEMKRKDEERLEEKFGKDADFTYFDNVDIDLVNALLKIDSLKNSDLYEQYIAFIKDRVDGVEQKDTDVKIQYNLADLSKSKELFVEEKRMIKKLAKRNSKLDIAEYIKPKGLLTRIKERLTRKKLTGGEPEKTREGQIEEELKSLADEPGFDIDLYYNQLEERYGEKLSSEERNRIAAQYAKYSGEKQFQKSVKVDVPIQQQNGESKTPSGIIVVGQNRNQQKDDNQR